MVVVVLAVSRVAAQVGSQTSTQLVPLVVVAAVGILVVVVAAPPQVQPTHQVVAVVVARAIRRAA